MLNADKVPVVAMVGVGAAMVNVDGIVTDVQVAVFTVKLKSYVPAALAGMFTEIGDAPRVALVIVVNPASALVPVAMLYWVGVPVVAEKGMLNDVEFVYTELIVPIVIVGTAFTVPLTATV